MQDNDTKDGFGTAPNEHYERFFNKFAEHLTLDPQQWKPVHLLGYFAAKYKEAYNINYQFKFNTPQPSKSFEMFQIRRVGLTLTSDAKILKEYIDWIFLNKVPQLKRRFTSVSFLTKEDNTREYKFNVLLASQKNKLNRSTPLPDNYKSAFAAVNKDVSTYGDLAFLISIKPMPQDVLEAFSKLVEQGFDIKTLSAVV